MGWPKGKKRGPGTGKKTRLPKVVTTPRRETELNERQERFVQEYLKDHSPGPAYLRAGYEVTDPKDADICGRRLLKDVRIMCLLQEARIKRIEMVGMDASKTVHHFYYMHLESLRQGDIANATKCLIELSKILGHYEKHNVQKNRQYTMEDIERLKGELKQNGFDIDAMRPSSN